MTDTAKTKETTEYNTNTARDEPARSPVRRGTNRDISAARDSHVDRTVGIDGPLPNRIFTLHPSTMVAALLAGAGLTGPVGSGSDWPITMFLCRKFFQAHRAALDDTREFTSLGTVVRLMSGRVMVHGTNLAHECGPDPTTPWIPPDAARWLRMPPVSMVWSGGESWYAKTPFGLYSWGNNHHGKLGQDRHDEWGVPGRVVLPGPVSQVRSLGRVCLFRTALGWWLAGWGDAVSYVPDLPDPIPDRCTAPRLLPGSGDVMEIHSDDRLTIGITTDRRLWTGATRKAEVIGWPDGIPVDRVLTHNGALFVWGGGQCYAGGLNYYGQLGTGEHAAESFPVRPVDTDGTVRDVATCTTTVLLTDQGLMCTGWNDFSQFGSMASRIATPVALPVPWPVDKVCAGENCLLVRRVGDGAWLARGRDGEGGLGVGSDEMVVREWRRVGVDGIVAFCPPFIVTTHGVFWSGRLTGDNHSLPQDPAPTPTPCLATTIPRYPTRVYPILDVPGDK